MEGKWDRRLEKQAEARRGHGCASMITSPGIALNGYVAGSTKDRFWGCVQGQTSKKWRIISLFHIVPHEVVRVPEVRGTEKMEEEATGQVPVPVHFNHSSSVALG